MLASSPVLQSAYLSVSDIRPASYAADGGDPPPRYMNATTMIAVTMRPPMPPPARPPGIGMPPEPPLLRPASDVRAVSSRAFGLNRMPPSQGPDHGPVADVGRDHTHI